jgi:hypothetical protein
MAYCISGNLFQFDFFNRSSLICVANLPIYEVVTGLDLLLQLDHCMSGNLFHFNKILAKPQSLSCCLSVQLLVVISNN